MQDYTTYSSGHIGPIRLYLKVSDKMEGDSIHSYSIRIPNESILDLSSCLITQGLTMFNIVSAFYKEIGNKIGLVYTKKE